VSKAAGKAQGVYAELTGCERLGLTRVVGIPSPHMALLTKYSRILEPNTAQAACVYIIKEVNSGS
jgi:hypothetical protein